MFKHSPFVAKLIKSVSNRLLVTPIVNADKSARQFGRNKIPVLWGSNHYADYSVDPGPKGLAAEGELPVCFASIRREMEDAQRVEDGNAAEVDYIFEIPLRVAQTLVGFKHDEVTQEQFVVLSRSVPKKGLIGRLFRG